MCLQPFFSVTRTLYSLIIPYQEKNIEALCENGMAAAAAKLAVIIEPSIKEEFIIYYLDLFRELEKKEPDFLFFDVRDTSSVPNTKIH